MPIFDFVCSKCSNKEEKLVNRSELDVQKCAECGELLIKSENFSNTSFALKGMWFKTRGRY